MKETTEDKKRDTNVEVWHEILQIPVGELEMDRRVQRQGLNMSKVRHIVKHYNEQAIGMVTVSWRSNDAKIIVDGQHRWEAKRIVTDNLGSMKADVWHGLTLAQEAQMFLDLNETTQPPVIDKFRVRLNTDGESGDIARDIQELVGAYGWTVSRVPANGNINCIRVVERLYALSKKLEAQPNLVQAAVLVITRAWGNDRHGTQGAFIEGIGRMFAEYGSQLDIDHLINVVKTQEGGPQSLLGKAQQLAAIRKSKVSMAVAELLVGDYNKGRRSRVLTVWRARA